jgi:hemolysin activation/secretion protein
MRIQKLPGYNTLQGRFSAQYSPDRLFLAEQFTLGGQGTIRGFEPAKIGGDSGFLTSIELNTSPLFPTETVFGQKVGDTIKFAFFGDYGSVFTSKQRADEKGRDSLWSLGAGARLYLGRHFSCRLDWAVPAIDDHLDMKKSMTYIQATLSF